ncbi:MAG: exodeoxyribonuclease VII small subunit [Chlamydiales bacterium]|nr:exodeoxyribonuclease VII small subunit [Chlamydiales bacterium]
MIVEKQPLSFEESFVRLEKILESINSGALSLEDSLTLYEEADALIIACNKKLSEAERKVEILIKNRQGELALGADQKPLTQEFSPSKTLI